MRLLHQAPLLAVALQTAPYRPHQKPWASSLLQLTQELSLYPSWKEQGTIVSAPGATALQDSGLELVVESAQAGDKAHEASRKSPSPTARLWKMSKPHMPAGILGITAAAAYGAVLPLFGFILGHIIADLYLQDEDLMRSRVHFWCIIFVCLGKQQQTIP